MESISITGTTFDLQDLELLEELLECEDRKLAIEVRHTDTAEFKHRLHQRMDRISAILEKVRRLQLS
jgi:hypothetical protein